MSQPEEMIERIVAGVLAQLQRPAATAPSPPARADHSPAQPGPAKTIEIQDDVVTGTLLEERGIISGTIVFGRKSVLTPSALDFLNTRKLAWQRADRNNAVTATRGKCLAIVTRSTPAVVSALDLIGKEAVADWNRELSGCHREAAQRAVSALCRGECDLA